MIHWSRGNWGWGCSPQYARSRQPRLIPAAGCGEAEPPRGLSRLSPRRRFRPPSRRRSGRARGSARARRGEMSAAVGVRIPPATMTAVRQSRQCEPGTRSRSMLHLTIIPRWANYCSHGDGRFHDARRACRSHASAGHSAPPGRAEAGRRTRKGIRHVGADHEPTPARPAESRNCRGRPSVRGCARQSVLATARGDRSSARVARRTPGSRADQQLAAFKKHVERREAET